MLDHRWRHYIFLFFVYLLAAPCLYIAFLGAYAPPSVLTPPPRRASCHQRHRYRPDSLLALQDSTLVRTMCKVMGASRGIPDYYRMLGLDPAADATQAEIKRAFRRMALQCDMRMFR